MPVVHPAEIWRETGRITRSVPELTRFKDRADRDMVLAMTHEEIVADIARQEINSYRQLPQIVYHLQTKWRDEPRARAGLIRVREFTMKDSYSSTSMRPGWMSPMSSTVRRTTRYLAGWGCASWSSARTPA